MNLTCLNNISEQRATRIATVAMAILTVAMIARTDVIMALGSDRYLQLPEDDFYYYAIIASNIAHHGWSTFDGITTTNGYHPIWMGLLVILASITGGIGGAFFVVVGLLQGICVMILFRILLALGRELYAEHRLMIPITLVVTTMALPHIFSGMEEALGIPLFALLLLRVARMPATAEVSRRQALSFGLLAALLVLTRLDAIILVGMIVLGWLTVVRLPPRIVLARLAAALAGGAPVPLYLLGNWLLFGTALPISGRAKQLLMRPGVSMHMLAPILGSRPTVMTVALLILGIGLARLARRRGAPPRISPPARFASVMIALFPPIFLGIHALLSDWWLWPWYNYWQPLLRLLLFCWICRSLATIFPGRLPWLRRATAAATVIGAGIVVTNALVMAIEVPPDWIYAHGKVIAAFARNHPGRYAMGDRAGLTAYLMRLPVVQLEGLVSDARLLERIAHGARLNDVLREYGVDYLVVSVYAPLPHTDGCYHVAIPDPLQSGERSARMRGTFRAAPLLFFTRKGECFTYIFAARE